MTAARRKATILTDEQAILAVLEGLHRAHHDKDVAAFAAHFAPHVVRYHLAPPLAVRGINPQGVQSWFDTWDGPIERTSRDFKITVQGDLAFGHGYYHMSGRKKGGEPVEMWMRATVCLQREQGAWRIVHEHTSVPFYMDGSLRAAVDLQP